MRAGAASVVLRRLRMVDRSVRVRGLPNWIDCRRLLGAGDWKMQVEEVGRIAAQTRLSLAEAAELEARLRGVGLAGQALRIEIDPALPRAAVRRARAEEAKRYREGSPGFSRRGTRLDPEARRSLTPEALALALGERARGARVIDACCGAGGNAIGFARAGCRVSAIELDRDRLALARHNAAVYGVSDRIELLHGDARELLGGLDGELLFVDPPWGERYDKGRVVLTDLPLLEALLAQRARFASTWLKVPPSFDPDSVKDARPSAWFGVGRGDQQRVKFLLLELG